ncbi:hypothetical protein G6F68_015543 [Rhizopus microsporus]|nr:hypothetical protein G6F68_015543 [Rhizopus microsporus]
MDADTDAVLIDKGVISPDDARERVAAAQTNGYHSLETNPDPDDGIDDEDEPEEGEERADFSTQAYA